MEMIRTNMLVLVTALALMGLGCSAGISGNDGAGAEQGALKGGIPAHSVDGGPGNSQGHAGGDDDGDVDEDADEGTDESGDAAVVGDGGDVDEDADEGVDEAGDGGGGGGPVDGGAARGRGPKA